MPARRSTRTSNFGVGRRESHDSRAFYERFQTPELSDDEFVAPPEPVAEPFVVGDAREMTTVADSSVALVVTSPPYFAGKAYEEELGREGVPGSYLEYLELLREVFAECVRTLEPGGRIAVNVANLGRKPYRSLSADVVGILQDDLGLLLRGEIVWQKAEGAGGSCAWGSFRSAANPVLRDLTERVIVAGKGRFDRAHPVARRVAESLPHESTMRTDDFLQSTLDLWTIPSESARRVGHPAPFPVALPEELIRLYTFRDDLVLDPFMGSGSTLVAASRLRRRYVGYDLDEGYVEVARRRVASEGAPVPDAPVGGAAGRAEELLVACGFTLTRRKRKVPRTGVVMDLEAEDRLGGRWFFLVGGAATSGRGGLLRTEEVWRALGRAHALRGFEESVRRVLLTAALPAPGSDGDLALHAAGPEALFDVVAFDDEDGRRRLVRYADEGPPPEPLPGFWGAGPRQLPGS